MAETMPNSILYTAFARVPIHFERGEGVRLYTSEGEEYLDFAAGIAVNSLGHSHPHLVEALKNQAEKLWHVSNLYESPQQESLGRRLCENSFADRVFFTNSGSESMECAFKTARRGIMIMARLNAWISLLSREPFTAEPLPPYPQVAAKNT